MNTPQVSIILPVFNAEKYLKESIDSCLSQSFTDFELIAVNDASTDNSLQILNQFNNRDSRVKVITVEKQESLGNVLNIGIKIAQGKYIARMDADDIMAFDRLKKQVEFLETHTDHVLVGGQIEIINEESEIVRTRKYPEEDTQLRKNLFIFQPFVHPAIMMRRESLIKANMYPENLKKVEDVKLMFKLSKIGKFANLNSVVLRYRVTFKTESQANMLEHFNKTNEVRKWAIIELGVKPTLRELIIWNFQKILVRIFSLLPNKLFLSMFELGRNILK